MKTTDKQKKEIWRNMPAPMKEEVKKNVSNVKELIERFALKLDDE